MITGINYNWYHTNEHGEEFDYANIGEHGVNFIKEHIPKGEGDKWFYNVFYDDGHIERVFNINKVFYKEETKC